MIKIVAYMPVFNEADILPFSLAYLLSQGISVHALENWSTDDSWEILSTTPGVKVERFPPDGPSKEYRYLDSLHRTEELAAQSGADWCMLNDADEWRSVMLLTPSAQWICPTLAEGIEIWDAKGFNAIDHRVTVFLPTDDDWDRQDPTKYFRHYTTDPAVNMLCGIPQVKTWKNVGRVDLASSGGHDVRFTGRRICPEKFILRHYPYMGGERSKQKLRSRIERRSPDEHRNGWSVQYDGFQPDWNGLWKPEQLQCL